MLFHTNATERMRITSGGNVLIGTTTDAGFKLQVNGEGSFYQSATNSTAYLRVENNRSRNAALRLSTTVGDYLVGVGIGADVNQFQIYDNVAGATRLTISSTGAATFSSSVTAGGNILGASIIMTPVTANPSSTAPALYQPATGELGINVNGGERMRIFSDGNVFIGSSPSNAGFKLDVNGTGRFSGNVTVVSSSSSTSIGTTGQIQITSSTGLAAPAGDIYLQSVIDSATPGDRGTAFVVQTGRTSGIAERFRIASTGAATFSSGIATSGYTASSSYAAIFNGAVGIGTSTPSTTDNLTLSSSTAFNLQLTNPGTGGVTWQIGATSNDYGSGGNRLVFTYGNASANSVLTLVQSTGNVLIGTTTDASYKLDVNGTGRFSAASTDYALTLQNIQDDSQGLLVRATDNDSNLYLIRAQSSNSSTSQTWVDRFTLAKNGAANFSSSVTANGTLSLQASATGSTATHVPVFTADPASTTRSLLTRTLQDFKFDVGSFIAKGVRSNAGDYTRTLDSVNDYSLWQDNFDWLASYNQSKVIIEAQTTGNINSSNTADKQLTIGWGISSDTNFNGDDYCTVNVPLGTGAVDYNVIINGTITITSNSELKMVIRVQIASGNVIEQNVMRMANVTAAGAMLNAAKNIAFTGKMNVTGTHTWSQRQTYLRLN
jgi:hypothetical protein